MKFFDENEILAKALRYYDKGDIFRSFIEESKIFPITINLKKIKERDIQNSFSQINKESKNLLNFSLPVLQKEFFFKTIGTQKLPYCIEFTKIEEYLHVINKTEKFESFKENYKKIVKKYPQLKSLFLKKPFIVLEYQKLWDKFFGICKYLIENSTPNIYIRELSIKGVDTKFIEKHKRILDTLISNIKEVDSLSRISDFAFEKKYNFKYPLPQVRFRLLDSNISGISDLTITIEEFKTLKLDIKKVFIVENKITTLSFPKIENSIVIFGSGYGVSILKDVQWLNDKDIYYWGDIDKDGYAILSQIRGYFSQVKSFFMDESSFERFYSLHVKQDKSSVKVLKHLTPNEKLVYKKLENSEIRIEQEKLPFEYIKKQIRDI